jgi:hypothetical protein
MVEFFWKTVYIWLEKGRVVNKIFTRINVIPFFQSMHNVNNELSVVMAIFLPLALRSSPALHIGFLEACLKNSRASPFHVDVAAIRASLVFLIG